jgi:CHAD domain-containing protein
MPLDKKQLLQPIRKIRKAVNQSLKAVTPEQVHDLRSQCRRLETTLYALKLEHTKPGRRLLKSIVPLRKAAGKVRDMDVLTALVLNISGPAKDYVEERRQLLEELGARRSRFAKRLRRAVSSRRSQVLRRLKRFCSLVDRDAAGGDATARLDPAAAVLSLSADLSAWANLDRNNLHRYRLRTKELRCMLQLGQASDARLLEELGRTKDDLGEWHDWYELDRFTCKLLTDRDFICQIHSIAEGRFADAITAARTLQRIYFRTEEARAHSRSGPPLVNDPILISAKRIRP